MHSEHFARLVTTRDAPTPAELAAGFEEWRQNQQVIAEQRQRFAGTLKAVDATVNSNAQARHADLDFEQQKLMRRYHPDHRSWENPGLFAEQERLLLELPADADELPKELLLINSGNKINVLGADGKWILLTKAVPAASTFVSGAQSSGYDIRWQQNQNGNPVKSPSGHLLNTYGIGELDPVICVSQGGKVSYYHAATGERLKRSAIQNQTEDGASATNGKFYSKAA